MRALQGFDHRQTRAASCSPDSVSNYQRLEFLPTLQGTLPDHAQYSGRGRGRASTWFAKTKKEKRRKKRKEEKEKGVFLWKYLDHDLIVLEVESELIAAAELKRLLLSWARWWRVHALRAGTLRTGKKEEEEERKKKEKKRGEIKRKTIQFWTCDMIAILWIENLVELNWIERIKVHSGKERRVQFACSCCPFDWRRGEKNETQKKEKKNKSKKFKKKTKIEIKIEPSDEIKIQLKKIKNQIKKPKSIQIQIWIQIQKLKKKKLKFFFFSSSISFSFLLFFFFSFLSSSSFFFLISGMSVIERKLNDLARYGRLGDVLSLLRDNPGLNVNWGDVKDSPWTALHYASSKGHVEVVKLLLAHPDINVNCQTRGGATPFSVGCGIGRVCVV